MSKSSRAFPLSTVLSCHTCCHHFIIFHLYYCAIILALQLFCIDYIDTQFDSQCESCLSHILFDFSNDLIVFFIAFVSGQGL